MADAVETTPTGRQRRRWTQASDFVVEHGKRLCAARQDAGMSQEDLAKQIGLTRSSVANMEAGRQAPMAELLLQIAAALGCDPRWLLTGWAPGYVAPIDRPATTRVAPKTVTSHVAKLRRLADELEATVQDEPTAQDGEAQC